MSLESGAKAAVAAHITADHAVRVVLSEQQVRVNGSLREGANPADNVHVIQVSTKNEALVTAIMDAVDAEGLA